MRACYRLSALRIAGRFYVSLASFEVGTMKDGLRLDADPTISYKNLQVKVETIGSYCRELADDFPAVGVGGRH